MQLIKVCQMMMQFVQYKNENQSHVQQLMEEDNHEMQVSNLCVCLLVFNTRTRTRVIYSS